jgi:hypothetical protein
MLDNNVAFTVGLHSHGYMSCEQTARRCAVLFAELMLTIQYAAELGLGILLAALLAAALLVPYLIKEIRRGKVELGPRTPTGTGEPHPGRRGDPAPGHPEAQADPYEPEARR